MLASKCSIAVECMYSSGNASAHPKGIEWLCLQERALELRYWSEYSNSHSRVGRCIWTVPYKLYKLCYSLKGKAIKYNCTVVIASNKIFLNSCELYFKCDQICQKGSYNNMHSFKSHFYGHSTDTTID